MEYIRLCLLINQRDEYNYEIRYIILADHWPGMHESEVRGKCESIGGVYFDSRTSKSLCIMYQEGRCYKPLMLCDMPRLCGVLFMEEKVA